jgi:putative peptidoglycan lipid II flippase
MLRGILTVGGWTMASRLLGFVRDIIIASLLGTGAVADAALVALRLPNLFRRLFGEGAFNAAFVPGFTAIEVREGREASSRFAGEAAAVLALVLLGLAVLAEIFMPFVAGLIAPGFRADPAKFALVVTLSRISFPYMPLICLAALVSGALNGLHRFAAAAAAPVLFNLVTIAALLLLRGRVPTEGHALAIGITVSGVLQLLMLAVAAHRAGLDLTPRAPRLSPAIRALLRRMGPALLGAGVTQINLFVDTIIASLLPAGTVSVLYYADRVAQLPLGTIGVAVGTALLPTLSRLVHAGDAAGARDQLNRAIEFGVFLTLPAALGLGVIGGPIVSVLFHHGAMTAQATHLTTTALAAYAAGLPAYVALRVLTPAFYARHDTATPVRVGLGTVALNVALNLAFMRPFGHLGPPMASATAAWVNAVVLSALLFRAGALTPDARLGRRALGMAASGLALVVVLLVATPLLYRPLAGTHEAWIGLALLIVAGGATYLLGTHLLGASDLGTLRRRLAKG